MFYRNVRVHRISVQRYRCEINGGNNKTKDYLMFVAARITQFDIPIESLELFIKVEVHLSVRLTHERAYLHSLVSPGEMSVIDVRSNFLGTIRTQTFRLSM